MKPLALLAPLALAACGQDRPQVILPPLALTTCADAPTPPLLAGKPATQEEQALRDKAVAGWIIDLDAAGMDCRSKVHGLAAWYASMRHIP